MSKTESVCSKLPEMERAPVIGQGKFATVHDWHHDEVVKLEDVTHTEYKRLGYVEDVHERMKLIEPLVRAHLAPKILGVGKCENMGVTFMKKVHGQTVENILRTGTPESISRVVPRVFLAIKEMHSMLPPEFGHGDLHTGNIFFTTKGRVNFIDFAFERRLSQSYDWKFFFDAAIEDNPAIKPFLVECVSTLVPELSTKLLKFLK